MLTRLIFHLLFVLPSDQCVKDCDDSFDADCGGFAKSWDERYGSSQDACCDQISSYTTRDKCTVDK